jgi:cytoskeleton protein RodZ
MGMTLLQVAEKLHVDAKVLESLEAERFDALGAPVYAKGHLRHYSELIGEQTSQLLDMYAAATKPVLPDLTQLPRAHHTSDPRKLVVPSLVVLIGFALVGTVWWVLQALEGKAGFSAPVAPRTVSETPLPEAPFAEAPAPDGASTSSPRSAASPAPPAAVVPMNGAAAPAARAVAGTATATRVTPGVAIAAQTGEQTAATAAAETPRARTIDVTLKFAADSWVEVYDANGARLFYDIGSADSSRKLTGTPPLRVVLGNAPGVTLDVNGKPAAVPASAVRDDSAQFLINRSGRIVRTRSQTDGG